MERPVSIWLRELSECFVPRAMRDRRKRAALADRLDRLQRVGETIQSKRPDLHQQFPDPRLDDFWMWLNRVGVREYPSVRQLVVPLPPENLRAIAGEPSEARFLDNGAGVYELLARVSDDLGQPLRSWGSILDFGCGPGRTLRYFLKDARAVELVGTDVDSDAIRWNQRNFPFGSFWTNDAVPPTKLPSTHFGFIYAISVFSHLSESNHLAWLEELRRIARPDGALMLTIHGRRALARTLSEPGIVDFLRVTSDDVENTAKHLDRHHYAFIRQPGGHLDTDLYGITFVDREYVTRRWGQLFEVVNYIEGAIDDWQDAVVLRMRA